jgi:hypothetical protein
MPFDFTAVKEKIKYGVPTQKYQSFGETYYIRLQSHDLQDNSINRFMFLKKYSFFPPPNITLSISDFTFLYLLMIRTLLSVTVMIIMLLHFIKIHVL